MRFVASQYGRHKRRHSTGSIVAYLDSKRRASASGLSCAHSQRRAAIQTDASTGAFSGDFTAAGSLTPTMAGVIFLPEEISLVSGEEIFDALFVGYIENQVAVEQDIEGDGIMVTFAAENAGEYVLQSSSDLTDWDDVETRTIPAHALFRTEVSATGANLFYRVKGL